MDDTENNGDNVTDVTEDHPSSRKRVHIVLTNADEGSEGTTTSTVKFEDTMSTTSSQGMAPSTTSKAPMPIKPATKGRPKAGDYDIATRSILQTAIEIYCAMLLNDDPFPSTVKELEWAKGAWARACLHHAVQLEHDATLLKLVSALCLFRVRSQFCHRLLYEVPIFEINSRRRLALSWRQCLGLK